ncbi:hypothetical protein J2Z17_002349, partial [Rhizobium halophytocola]|nr:hypothetical protein [Rhizobium halophytocola]
RFGFRDAAFQGQDHSTRRCRMTAPGPLRSLAVECNGAAARGERGTAADRRGAGVAYPPLPCRASPPQGGRSAGGGRSIRLSRRCIPGAGPIHSKMPHDGFRAKVVIGSRMQRRSFARGEGDCGRPTAAGVAYPPLPCRASPPQGGRSAGGGRSIRLSRCCVPGAGPFNSKMPHDGSRAVAVIGIRVQRRSFARGEGDCGRPTGRGCRLPPSALPGISPSRGGDRLGAAARSGFRDAAFQGQDHSTRRCRMTAPGPLRSLRRKSQLSYRELKLRQLAPRYRSRRNFADILAPIRCWNGAARGSGPIKKADAPLSASSHCPFEKSSADPGRAEGVSASVTDLWTAGICCSG